MLLAEQDQLVAQLAGELVMAEQVMGIAGEVEEQHFFGQRRRAAFLLQLGQHRQGAQRRETAHFLYVGQALDQRRGRVGEGQA
jgi:hypothetical protein